MTSERIVLTSTTRGQRPKEHPVWAGRSLIGRAYDADIHIDDPWVSRQHLYIEVGNGDVSIEPVSEHPVHVNGAAVSGKTRIQLGDELAIGDTKLILQQPASTAAIEVSLDEIKDHLASQTPQQPSPLPAGKRTETDPGDPTGADPASLAAGGTVKKLRERLLELSTRNRLLHHPHPPKHSTYVRVVDELPDFLFERLLSGGEMHFKALPEPPKGVRVLTSAEASKGRQQQLLNSGDITTLKTISEWAEDNGVVPSFDLPRPSGPSAGEAARHVDDWIQTLLLPTKMAATLRKVTDKARVSVEERGVNTLFMVFGFLEWIEQRDPPRSRVAPLLMVPVAIQRTLKKSIYEHTISALAEEPVDNLTLRIRLRRDFGIELPKTTTDSGPEAYWEEVEKAVAKEPGWRIRRHVTLTNLSFARIAMYEDLDPERWWEEAVLKLPGQPLIRRVFGMGPEGKGRIEKTYSPDDARHADIASSLIYPCDASQFTVIVDAVNGKNLAVQGPPGTGKSQCITNLIAALLAQGRSVLFLAEKMAALNVVKKRLDAAGLGDFCLELHSEKIKPKVVLDALAARDVLRVTLPSLKELQAKREEIERIRDSLNQAAQLLNSPFGAMGLSPHQMYWSAMRADGACTNSDALKGEFFDGASKWSTADVNERRRAVRAVAGSRRKVVEPYGSVGKHPWCTVTSGDLDKFKAEELVHLVESWSGCLGKVEKALTALDRSGFEPVPSLSAAAALVADLERLPLDDVIDASLVAKVAQGTNLQAGRSLLKRYEELVAKERAIAADLVPGAARLERHRDLEAAVAALEPVRESDGELPLSGFLKRADELNGLARRATEAVQTLDLVLDRLQEGDPQERCLADYATAAALLRLLTSLSDVGRSYRRLPLGDPLNRTLVREAANRAQELEAQRIELDASLDLSAISPEDQPLRDAVSSIRSAGFFARLMGPHRNAKKLYLGARREPVESWDTDARSLAADELSNVLKHRESVATLEQDSRLRGVLGVAFNGVDTRFDALEEVARLHEGLREELPGASPTSVAARRFVTDASESEVDDVLEVARLLDRENLVAFERLAGVLEGDRPASELVEQAASREHELRTAHALAAPLFKSTDPAASNAADQLSLALDHVVAKVAVGRAPENAAFLDERGLDGLAVEPLQTACRAVRLVREAPSAQLLSPLLAEWDRLGPWLKKWASSMRVFIQQERAARAALDAKQWMRLVPPAAGRSAMTENLPARALARWTEDAVKHQGALDAIVQWRGHQATADRLGLGAFLKQFDFDGKDDVADAFEAVLFRSLIREVEHRYPALRELRGADLEQLRKRFAELDDELIKVSRLQIRARLLEAEVEEGNNRGKKSEWTERSLILHEKSKKGRHIRLRQLFRRAGRAAQQLKPCFLMSPLSVAQFLAPGALEFDVLVIDEASQMKPEDALGALARSRQCVIVGDPKQLPPTAFFTRSYEADDELDDADDEEADEAPDSESILDKAATTFHPSRSLLWHYRSRHQSLIAFSNHHFYGGSLTVFPAPTPQGLNGAGVALVEVKGTYKQGRRVNAFEAKVVVSAAMKAMRESPELTLGIATLNQPQRDLILEEMDQLRSMDRDVAAYFERHEKGIEPPFVKNLENVQGDERDIILVSCTFGPDEKGNVYQRFGPINSPVGHRRLNVLFTRAKQQLIVFSSLKPSHITVTPKSNRGLIAFRDYLLYAGGTPLQTAEEVARSGPENAFEQMVMEALQSRGYDVEPQVGVAGYRIDLGVRSPDPTRGFLAGIECDGATYHSARSARERDRARQQILENLGWRIYRVWSTDWFRSPPEELKHLVSFLEDAATEDRYAGPQQVSTEWAQVAKAAALGDVSSLGLPEVLQATADGLADSGDDRAVRPGPGHDMIDEVATEGTVENLAPSRESGAPAQTHAAKLPQQGTFASLLGSSAAGEDEHEAATSVDLPPPPDSDDAILDALCRVEPMYNEPRCPDCRSAAALTLDDDGPATHCTNSSCKSRVPVPHLVRVKLLREIGLRCPACGEPGRNVGRIGSEQLKCSNGHTTKWSNADGWWPGSR